MQNMHKDLIKTKENTESIISQNTELNTSINKLQSTVDKISAKLQINGANIPEHNLLKEKFVVMKKNNSLGCSGTNDIYTIIRAQERSASASISRKLKQGFVVMSDIANIASSVGTWLVVKDQLLEDKMMVIPDKRKYNDFKLNNITLQDLIDIITTIHMSCKEV